MCVLCVLGEINEKSITLEICKESIKMNLRPKVRLSQDNGSMLLAQSRAQTKS